MDYTVSPRVFVKLYNEEADARLQSDWARQAVSDQRFLQRRAAIAGPAFAALVGPEGKSGAAAGVLYRDLGRSTDPAAVTRELRPVLDYFSRDAVVSPRLRAAPAAEPLSLSDLRQAQRDLRSAVATLVLSDREASGLAAWKLPAATLTATIARGEVYGLGPDLTLKPRALQLVYPGATALVDAMPWIRFCTLCHRLFFRVKAKAFCSEAHSLVYFARKWRAGDQGPGLRPRRGPKPVEYEEPIDRAHVAWLKTAQRQP